MKRFLDTKNRPIVLLLIVGFVIGILVTRQYGESWDELQFFKYADRALAAYTTWPTTGSIPLTGNTYDDYGPAFVMFTALSAQLLHTVLSWSISDLRHLIYFFDYLVGIWAFFQLGKRWLTRPAAFGATLLFATQPLFWGHAFISPKDIPFLTFFLLSLEFGFRMVDSAKPISLDALSPSVKRTLLVLTALWLASVFGLFAATNLIHAWLDDLVRAAAAGQTNIISLIASDVHKVKPEIYVQKYFVYFLWTRAIFCLLFTFLLAGLWHRNIPTIFRYLLSITPAAFLLGITTSIRVLGPFAGLMVIAYALWKSGKRFLPVLAAYGLLALFIMYLTWPYLWPDPIGHFIESVQVMSNFPWNGRVLFNGSYYASTAIPRSYLPVLLGIQLTEPVWFLFAAGLAITIYGTIQKQENHIILMVLALIWFLVPLTGFIVTRAPLYDNFRQIIFILPPVFLLAGAAFEKIKPPILQAALIGLLVLPGVVDGARLHPYEYIYYNHFIGGVAGAQRRFELDYWGTSYREAAGWLNDNAPANATIWVEGPAHLLQLYARSDLKLFSTYESDRADHYDYVVATSRYNLDLISYPNARIVHTITRDGAILTAIKKP